MALKLRKNHCYSFFASLWRETIFTDFHRILQKIMLLYIQAHLTQTAFYIGEDLYLQTGTFKLLMLKEF